MPPALRLSILLALLATPPSSGQTPTVLDGSQFQVNTYTTGYQGYPSVAVDASGDFVVVWLSFGSDSDDTDFSVQGQRFRVTGDVGDWVWLDEDFDGLQGALEPGIEAVRVNLYDAESSLVDWQETDASGEFLFREKPGDYYLEFELPAIYGFTAPDVGGGAGNSDTLDSDADPATGQTIDFTIVAGATDPDWDAGLIDGAVGDFVWQDLDVDGFQDAGEPGLGEVSVTLFDAALGTPVAGPIVTAGDGAYDFTSLSAGDYYLELAAPAGFVFTLDNQGGDDTRDSDADAASGLTPVFFFAPGDLETSWDAGLVPDSLAGVGDRVWLDADLDGVQDGGESGVAGVAVELFDLDGTSQGSTATAADGSYSFTGLAAGTYYLSFAEPGGFCYTAPNQGGDDALDSDVDPVALTTAPFVLAVAQSDATRDAGLVPDASVGNRVWHDDDGNGLQEGGEPGLGNVTVRLYDSGDTQLGETQTDAGGHYGFSPGPGDYYLEFLLPADMAFTLRDQGSDDAIDSDVNPASGTTALFSLGPGAVRSRNRAGAARGRAGCASADPRRATA